MRNCTKISRISILLLTVALCYAHTSSGQDAVPAEAASNAEPVSLANAEQAAAPDSVVDESFGEDAPSVKRTAQFKPQASDLAILAEELNKKSIELKNANSEIQRLRDIVKKMANANLREQATMHYNMGCVYKVAGENGKAESEFLKCLQCDPNDAAAHYNLGILYEENLKEPKKAAEHYSRYLALEPSGKDSATVNEWLKSLIE